MGLFLNSDSRIFRSKHWLRWLYDVKTNPGNSEIRSQRIRYRIQFDRSALRNRFPVFFPTIAKTRSPSPFWRSDLPQEGNVKNRNRDNLDISSARPDLRSCRLLLPIHKEPIRPHFALFFDFHRHGDPTLDSDVHSALSWFPAAATLQSQCIFCTKHNGSGWWWPHLGRRLSLHWAR